MKLLLDTHVFLWADAAPDKLNAQARSAIASVRNEVYVSALCVWELTMKHALGRLALPVPPSLLEARIAALGFRTLPFLAAHAAAIATLPPLHRDPFDRGLLAQALVEGQTFVTADAGCLRYPGAHLKAR